MPTTKKTKEEKRAAKTAAQRARREAQKMVVVPPRGKAPAGDTPVDLSVNEKGPGAVAALLREMVAGTKPATKKEKKASREAPAGVKKPSPFVHDERIPKDGTTISRVWHGKTYEVVVRADCFEYAGAFYRSLTAVAKAITGFAAVNGLLWFGLTAK